MARFGRTDPYPPSDLDTPGNEDQPGTELAPADTAEVVTYSPEVVAALRELVAGIPENDDQGAENIITQLLAAKTVDDLNEPWEGTSGKKLAGQRLMVRSITARKSSYEGGTGIFLVADASDAKTGERKTFTTSAMSVVIQLAKAHQLRMFPLLVEIVVAGRPTARGFYPYHLRVLAAGSSAAGGVSA